MVQGWYQVGTRLVPERRACGRGDLTPFVEVA